MSYIIVPEISIILIVTFRVIFLAFADMGKSDHAN